MKVYIVVLNWNNAVDTIACIESLISLKYESFSIVICDNNSTDGSYDDIQKWLDQCQSSNFNVVYGSDSLRPNNNRGSIYLIQTGSNRGYAAGNNVGINFALLDSSCDYIWVLNNDTLVDSTALSELVYKMDGDQKYGICGSKLIYEHDRELLQGVGGIYNPWFCTTKHYLANYNSSMTVNESQAEAKIDYVIGASIFFRKSCINDIGVFCEDYFLYYEELDICKRASDFFDIGIASKSLVYHKEGASTGGGKSLIADYYSVKNRLTYTFKYNRKMYFFVYFSILYVLLNRIRRGENKKAMNIVKILLGIKVKFTS